MRRHYTQQNSPILKAMIAVVAKVTTRRRKCGVPHAWKLEPSNCVNGNTFTDQLTTNHLDIDLRPQKLLLPS
jgi:hypothetical protein